MSDGRFYAWVHDGVVDRRGTVALLVGLLFGWTGATLVDEDAAPTPNDSGALGGASGGEGAAGGTTAATTTAPEPTDTPTVEPPPTATAEPTPTATPTATTTSTATPSANRELRAELDVSSRGFGDETSYQIIYSIHNRNDVTVTVTFESTVSLQNGETLRQDATATIDPGQAATDEFVFEGYDSSPSGWGFQVTDARQA